MQMTRLEEHPTTTGTLVRWAPTAASRARMASAPLTPQRGSYMQEAHLGLRRAMEREGRRDASWIGIAFDLASPIDPERMSLTLAQIARRHDIFRGWFGVDGDHYPWHQLGAGDLEFEMQEVGTAETEAEVRRFVLTELTTACTPFDDIGWSLCGVVGADTAVLYLGQDHVYTDGFSIILLFNELVNLYSGRLEPADLPATGQHRDHAHAERVAADAATIDHPAVGLWADFALADPEGGTPRFPMDTGVSPGDKTALAPYRLDLVDHEESMVLEKYAANIGATFPSLVHAALALTSRDLAGKSLHRFLSPIHTRTAPEWWQAMGWFINVLPVACQVTANDGINEVAVRMRHNLRACQEAAALPALRVMELIEEVFGFDPESASRPPIISWLDGRNLPGQDLWDEHRFHGLTGSGEHDDVNVWLNRMPTETYVMCAVPDTPKALDAVDRYFQHVRTLLRSLIGSH